MLYATLNTTPLQKNNKKSAVYFQHWKTPLIDNQSFVLKCPPVFIYVHIITDLFFKQSCRSARVHACVRFTSADAEVLPACAQH